MRIEVRRGDIADQPDLGVVTNAANTELWMGSGVAGALKRRGGASIEEDTVRQGPITLGDAVVTAAGALPNRFVIHAAAMGFRAEDAGAGAPGTEGTVQKRPGSRSSAAIIRAATLRVLALCEERGVASVGFPALASGVGGFPIDECTATMIGACLEHARDHRRGSVGLVAFGLRGEDDRAAFAAALAEAG